MVKLLVMLLGMAGILHSDSETYRIINTIGDGAFYFLPVMVAASAAKKFKTDMFLAIAIAGVLIHPDFRAMMETVTVGDTAAHFAGIPIASVKYTYTVIPSLCMTWILSYIERGIDRITPAVTKNFLKPMLILLIAAPIAILIIGPAGIFVGQGISAWFSGSWNHGSHLASACDYRYAPCIYTNYFTDHFRDWYGGNGNAL